MIRPLCLLLAAVAPLAALDNPGRRTAPPEPPPAVTHLPVFQIPSDDRPFTRNPEGAGISVDGLDEELRPFSGLTITFPAEMVPADRIDAPDVESPIAIWPPVDVEFSWSTQTQGYLTINGPLIPGQIYRFRLREGLKDLAGAPLAADQWGAEMITPGFQIVEENYGERDSLNARPQVPLEFNYPVQLAHAAEGLWFQDRATRRRFPAEVLLNLPEGGLEEDVAEGSLGDDEKIYGLRVRPRDPLPVGAFYDLVVDGVVDAYAGRGLDYPRVFPLGPTRPLEVRYVQARNEPLEKPSIDIKFDQSIEDSPLPADAIRVTPPVANQTLRKQARTITIDGDFHIGTRYVVEIAPSVRGSGGYSLAKAEKWGATFRPRLAAVLFPDRLLRQRSALGFRFAFYQVNTGDLTWKLAPIPLDRLSAVSARLEEFQKEAEDGNGNVVWTDEGKIRRAPTELLVPAFGLEPVATGSVPASWGDTESLREVSWSAAPLDGPVLFEISGTDARGRTVGNRAVIYFGDHAITRKATPAETILRIARLADGQPAEGVTVQALDKTLAVIASGTTGPDGLASFSRDAIPGAEYFSATENGRVSLQPVFLSDAFSSGYLSATPPPPLRAWTFTDRPLYRPGQTVSFKGLVREASDNGLKIPVGRKVAWRIERSSNEWITSGETTVDAEGGWNATWTPPADGPLGHFSLVVRVGDTLAGATRFQIEEFRNPPFSVVCEPGESQKPGEAVITAESQYFHGAPNAGASVAWTATWVSDSDGDYYDGGSGDDFKRVDLYSQHRRTPVYMAEVSGEAALDGNGRVVLRCEPPFKDPGNRARCQVSWKVDVTGPDGQTITGGADQRVPMLPVLLGVRSVDADEPGRLAFAWDAEEFSGSAPEAVKAELFHVVTKTVKERLAPNVYRYRNTDRFHLVEKRDRVTEDRLTFAPREPGRYVLLLTPPDGGQAMPVSEEAYLEGDEPSENPVTSDTIATVLSLQGGRAPNDRPWNVGDTAQLTVLSPTPGVAWVSVETDRILDTFTVPLDGNTSTIAIPIKPEYEPNAFVSVYLLRPGGDDRLAGEMFGYCPLAVTNGTRKLDIAVTVGATEYEPGQKITGTVRVTAAGRPVAGADLAISAVDDAILTLGGWSLPSFLSTFFPSRSYAVITYSALRAYVDRITPSWLTSKGFVIGDGGADLFSNVTFARKEFKPIILWKPSVKTDASGVATFTCEAPDNLTRFRVVAVGQSRANQFGAGDATFEVTRNLLIEPALPRFVREGDEVELRAVVRQKFGASEPLAVRCTAGGSLALAGDSEQEVTADRNAPVVVRFRAKAGAVGAATVKFQVVSRSNPRLNDAVELTLPVAEPVILRTEAVGGRIGNTSFRVAEVAPGAWENARGTFSFAVSTTPWLSKLMGLPYLLTYPHGCFEQKTSRLLAYTYLGGLLAYLPEEGARRENYGFVIEKTLGEIEASLLPGGRVPYWPQGTTANEYVTIQAAWCVAAAEEAGFTIPERLATELPEALESIVLQNRRVGYPASLRTFALFVSSLSGSDATNDLVNAARELYLQRDKLTGEGRALLAIALNRLNADPDKQVRLVSELPERFERFDFNPETFASTTRTEALCLWARILIGDAADTAALRERLGTLMESSASHSTQENLWLLVAFDALLKQEKFSPLRRTALTPAPQALSANQTGAAWTGREIARLADFVVRGLPSTREAGSYVLKAAYRTGETETPLESQGMRIERVVKNLTDPARTGAAGSPFRLGDQLVISYRFSSETAQSFVALEDLLPAGVEVVNPNLALFGKYYAPPEPGAIEAPLSHSEMRDRQTNLYFDHLPAGTSSYAVLARATAVGSFVWPATQIQPMYDSRFFGRSPSSTCHVAE